MKEQFKKDIARAAIMLGLAAVLRDDELQQLGSHFDTKKLENAAIAPLEAAQASGMDEVAFAAIVELLKETFPEAVRAA